MALTAKNVRIEYFQFFIEYEVYYAPMMRVISLFHKRILALEIKLSTGIYPNPKNSVLEWETITYLRLEEYSMNTKRLIKITFPILLLVGIYFLGPAPKAPDYDKAIPKVPDNVGDLEQFIVKKE